MNPAFTLKNFTSLNQISHSTNLERNLVMFFDYGCMKLSGYQNISFNTIQNGQPLGQLKPVDSPQYPATTTARAWESYRTNWVWGGTGITPTGVYVNGNFSGTGFNVNYKNGQIIFDNPVSVNSTVKASFSPKSIYWDTSDSAWYRDLITETYKYDAFNADGIGSGIRATLTNHRIQLPAVIIQVTSANNFTPYELGGGSNYNPDINFYVFAENPAQRRLIIDLICSQNNHSFLGVDFNSVITANALPFNSYGFLVSGAKTFEQLQPLYPWNVKPIYFNNLQGKEVPFATPIYRGLIHGNAGLVLCGV